MRPLVSLTALASSLAYIGSDVAELLGHGFSPAQLYVTYAAFVAVPFFILGLHALQGPRAGWLSLIGAVCYATSFIFYAGTAVYAIVAGTPDYETLVSEMGALYTFHGALLVIGGLLFGAAAIRAAVWPRWTGIALIVGVLLSLFLALVRLPDIMQTAASTIRSVAFVGMAVAALQQPSIGAVAVETRSGRTS
ncbi:MAG TPA: hypothetical protein VGT40_15355 [Methylomirabilota bacterium]|jgi:hypothetical protein|nr:hypothetical protein [Methylomirabilota bacterium]